MCRLILLAALLAWLSPAFAAEPVLTLHFGDETWRLTTAELLARPDAQSITMTDQDAYKRPMTRRAVPLLALLPSNKRFDTLEVRATDGFSATRNRCELGPSNACQVSMKRRCRTPISKQWSPI